MFCYHKTKSLAGGILPPNTPFFQLSEFGMRDKIARVRLTQDEHEQLSKLADENDLTLSEYIRRSALKRKTKITTEFEKALYFEINRIGNNLNQIAKYVNTNKKLDKFVLKSLVSIERELKELLK